MNQLILDNLKTYMTKILQFFFLVLICLSSAYSQTISEKELYTLSYKGTIEIYNFTYDQNSGTYCYIYRIEDENKVFIISNNSMSEKYDDVIISDIHFDSKGNYYTNAANYKKDYGIDNNFLVVNGKQVLNFSYIEGHSAYVNSKGEYVFIFKEFDKYKIGYYSVDKGFKGSEAYEYVKPIYSNDFSNLVEGEAEALAENNFYHNENGERGFIALSNAGAKLIFETSVIQTNYSDIHETSLTTNNNNELSFIAKKAGRFYEGVGNELVVSGNKEYDIFETVMPSLLFNSSNEPVYVAADSISDLDYDYYVVAGNQKQDVFLDKARTQKAPHFGYGVNELKIQNDDIISYTGMEQIVVPALKTKSEEESYDQYYSKSYFVKDGIAEELGYNLRATKYDSEGGMVYAGMPDLKKQQPLLFLKNGSKKVTLNQGSFDEIYEFGFAPNKEIYYLGQNYEDPKLNKKYENYLYIGDKLIGKYDAVIFQMVGDNASVLKFDAKNNYAFVVEDIVDTITRSTYIMTNNGKLSFPKTFTKKAKKFEYISNLMFTNNDKLFYIGELKIDTNYVKEIFVDNTSMEKVYENISEVNYDEKENEILFYGTRGKKIYYVTVRM